MASQDPLPTVPPITSQPILVDFSATRRKVAQFEQLPSWYHCCFGWCGRYFGAYTVQGVSPHTFPSTWSSKNHPLKISKFPPKSSISFSISFFPMYRDDYWCSKHGISDMGRLILGEAIRFRGEWHSTEEWMKADNSGIDEIQKIGKFFISSSFLYPFPTLSHWT